MKNKGKLVIVLCFMAICTQLFSGERRETTTEPRPEIWEKSSGKAILMAEQVARADAMRKMLEKIYGMEIDGELSVYNLCQVDKRVDVSVRGVLRGMREKKWHFYEDGSCQVELEVTWREIIEKIEKSIREKKINGHIVDSHKFIKRNITHRDKDLTVWGSGAIAGTRGVQVIQAQRAAEIDAYERLAERIMGLEIDSDTRVRDMALRSDEICTAIAASLKGVDFTDYRITDKWVEADGEVVLETIIKRIERTCQRIVDKKRCGCDRISTRVVEKITTDKKHKILKETGKGLLDEPRQNPVTTTKSKEVVKKIVEKIIITK